MSCEDIPSLLDIQNTKKHIDDFGRLMGTGTGTSTNGVTGQVRPTYNAVMANLGYTRVGTFATGATLLNGRQTLLWDIADGGDGQEYGWSGSFLPSGKVVSPGSTPLTTGGISVGAWMSRFDPELRQNVTELTRRSYAEAGYNVVGTFQAGFTYVNANDVGVDITTGKGYTGPIGPVSPGTNPISPVFVDRSDELLRNNLTADLVGFSSDLLYAPATVGYRLANSIYVTDYPFNAKCDGVTDDALSIQAAIDYAVSVDKQCVQPGISYIGSQIVAKGVFIGFGPDFSGFVSNDPIFALRTNFDPATKRLSGMSVKSTAQTQATCKLRGFDTTGATPHFSVIENMYFERLIQAIKIDPFFYSNTFRDIICYKCGTPTDWAVEYVDSGRVDGANNILWDGLTITSDSTWLARGLKVASAWDTTFNHLHLENLGDYAVEFGGRAISVSGGYIEQHNTLGTGIYTSNQILLRVPDTTFTGVLINANVVLDKVATLRAGEYVGCNFNDGGFVPAGAVLRNTKITGNRVVAPLPYMAVDELVHISRGSPVNIPFLSKRSSIGINGNFSTIAAQAWAEGALGELRYNGGAVNLETDPASGLFNPIGLTIKPSQPLQSGVVWQFQPRVRQANGQSGGNKLTAWALVKVVSVSGTLQVSFGLGGAAFQDPSKLAAVDVSAGWSLLIVDDVAPFDSYVTFALNAVGGGNPQVGLGEYVMVDSFGVCVGGVDYRNVFGMDNK